MKHLRKLLNKPKLLFALGMVLLGLVFVLAKVFRTSAKEIP